MSKLFPNAEFEIKEFEKMGNFSHDGSDNDMTQFQLCQTQSTPKVSLSLKRKRSSRSTSKTKRTKKQFPKTSSFEDIPEDSLRDVDVNLAETISFDQNESHLANEDDFQHQSVLNKPISGETSGEENEASVFVEKTLTSDLEEVVSSQVQNKSMEIIDDVSNAGILDQCLSSESLVHDLTENQSKLFDAANFTSDEKYLAEIDLTKIESSIGSYPENTFYGLPLQVQEILIQTRGISRLYEWQNDCLNLPSVIKRMNMVYSLPTSGGKTLVAEILMMQEILLKKRNVIMVLPYVSIVQEKVRDLSPFAVQLGFYIEEYASRKGCIPPKKRRMKNTIYIATIEKATSIVNSLVENDRIDELGKVVVDELHMIGEGGSRSALLEILLTTIMYKFRHVQIIGMSATLGNMGELQEFMKAEIYTNEFRPVELTEYVKMDNKLYKVNPQALTDEELCIVERHINHPMDSQDEAKRGDPDHIVSLAREVVPKHSCMVFCATKKNCENVALLLARNFPREDMKHREEEKLALLRNIYNVANGICNTLKKTIPFGIAYHHSGLTMDERKLVEDAYSSGVLCLLCCTSTLAAGVNLPAKRVILRSPYVGNQLMSRAQYKQMIGRAGRAGIDSSGESILVISQRDKGKLQKLIRGCLGTCASSLMYDNGKGLRELILSLLGLKICEAVDDLVSLFRTTLCHIQEKRRMNSKQASNNETLLDVIRKEVDKLVSVGMLSIMLVDKQEQGELQGEQRSLKVGSQESNAGSEEEQNKEIAEEQTSGQNNTTNLNITDLGRATVKGCMDIDFVPTLYKELKRSLDGLVLSTDLHLLYLATPFDQTSHLNVKWMTFYRQFSKLNEADAHSAEYIGIKESSLMRKATGQSSSKFDDSIYKRFYLTIMLYHLMKKKTIWQVAETFETTRGFLQNLLSSSISFASLLVYFTAEIREFWALKLLFQSLVEKLTSTGDVDLAPLLDIPGVKQARARQLFKKGYHSLKDLALVDASTLCGEIEYLPRRQAQLIISSAKMLLQEKVEALREEADDIAGVT